MNVTISARGITSSLVLLFCGFALPLHALEDKPADGGDKPVAPPPAVDADKAVPGDKKTPDADDKHATKREMRKKERDNPAAADAPGGGKGPRAMALDGRRPGGPGGLGMSAIEREIRHQIGLDSQILLSQLPMGFDQHMAFKVPVGGIDTLDDFGDGLKAEDVFGLTPEQTKSMETLREEYKAKLDEMQKRLDDVNKAMADQIRDLRKTYELKANDVLTGDAKTGKEKLDAIAADWLQRREALAKEQQPKQEEMLAEARRLATEAKEKPDRQNWQEWFDKTRESIRGMREWVFTLAKDTSQKMKDALSGEAKANLEMALLKIENRRQKMMQGFGGPGGKDGGNKDGGPGRDKPRDKKGDGPAINAEKPLPAPDF